MVDAPVGPSAGRSYESCHPYRLRRRGGISGFPGKVEGDGFATLCGGEVPPLSDPPPGFAEGGQGGGIDAFWVGTLIADAAGVRPPPCPRPAKPGGGSERALPPQCRGQVSICGVRQSLQPVGL